MDGHAFERSQIFTDLFEAGGVEATWTLVFVPLGEFLTRVALECIEDVKRHLLANQALERAGQEVGRSTAKRANLSTCAGQLRRVLTRLPQHKQAIVAQ